MSESLQPQTARLKSHNDDAALATLDSGRIALARAQLHGLLIDVKSIAKNDKERPCTTTR